MPGRQLPLCVAVLLSTGAFTMGQSRRGPGNDEPGAARAALARLVEVAAGRQPADLVVEGGRVLDVFTGEIQEADVAVSGGLIAGVGRYSGAERLDARGLFVLPGFIDGHIHIESSQLTPDEFARAVASHGTTTVVADPHEVCNVAGPAGMRYMLDRAAACAIDVKLMAPSCVPATHLETAGARLEADDVRVMLGRRGVLGLAEMMNFPGVVGADPAVLAKLAAAAGRPVDGHAPGLTGPALQAYVAAGPRSDHECTTLDEAQEKLRAGMHILIRDGSAARNLETLAPLLSTPAADRCLIVSDDRNPEDLLSRGHLDGSLRRAVELGVGELAAVRAVTLSAARAFGLTDRGAVAPGLRADLALVRDLRGFEVAHALVAGRHATGRADAKTPPPPAEVTGTCRLPALSEDSFRVPAPRSTGPRARVRVIEVIPEQIVTRASVEELPVSEGFVASAPERDIVLLAVVERHGVRGTIGLGFVKGLGLRRGVLASTVAHDSHNLILAGSDPAEMLAAAREVAAMGGGQLTWEGGRCVARLPLPVAGLMSAEPVERVASAHRALRESSQTLGCGLPDPFMQLSFLALPVIPELKLTDLGLVDVAAFGFVPVRL